MRRNLIAILLASTALATVLVLSARGMAPSLDEWLAVVGNAKHGDEIQLSEVEISRLTWEYAPNGMVTIWHTNNNKSITLRRWMASAILVNDQLFLKVSDFDYFESQLMMSSEVGVLARLFNDGKYQGSVNPTFKDYHALRFGSSAPEISAALRRLGFVERR